MSFFNSLFQKKDNTPINSYSDFWNWFSDNQKQFFQIVKSDGNIEKDFFNKVSPKLDQIGECFLLTGMSDKNTAELVFTADGNLKNFFFIEELVAAAPKIDGWLFTAFKPSMDIESMSIKMNGYIFDKENLFFYSNEDKEYPDLIDISVFYSDINEENKPVVSNGIYIFLDNYLGELEFSTNIDSLTIVLKEEVDKELVPIGKLKDFLIWREKEFVEKYQGKRHNTEEDEYSGFEATLQNGSPLIALINMTLLDWDAKPSHPWILTVKIHYAGKSNNGMPNEEAYNLLNQIEDEMMTELKDSEGYLNVGRETADDVREIYFACNEFYKPSKIASATAAKYQDVLNIEYEIFKDKYWQSLERFKPE